jgi:hypothetical protein
VLVALSIPSGSLSLVNYLYEYFKSDNEPDDIENATHNTFPKLTWI